MPHQIKMATCCYCGKRTVLRPTARDGHELACGACGAPLHNMKAMPVKASSEPKKAAKNTPGFSPAGKKPKTKTYRKKRKSLWQKALEEAWDVFEDIFD